MRTVQPIALKPMPSKRYDQQQHISTPARLESIRTGEIMHTQHVMIMLRCMLLRRQAWLRWQPRPLHTKAAIARPATNFAAAAPQQLRSPPRARGGCCSATVEAFCTRPSVGTGAYLGLVRVEEAQRVPCHAEAALEPSSAVSSFSRNS